MLGNCNACQSHGLSETDFITESNVSSNCDSDSNSDTGSGVSGYLSKMQMALDRSDALDRC